MTEVTVIASRRRRPSRPAVDVHMLTLVEEECWDAVVVDVELEDVLSCVRTGLAWQSF